MKKYIFFLFSSCLFSTFVMNCDINKAIRPLSAKRDLETAQALVKLSSCECLSLDPRDLATAEALVKLLASNKRVTFAEEIVVI